jgi:hypothetical protein
MMIDVVSNWFFGLYDSLTSMVNNYFPQVTSFVSEIPFVGEILSNVSNSELAIILLLILVALYLKKFEWVVKWVTVAIVIIIIMILFGVVNI